MARSDTKTSEAKTSVSVMDVNTARMIEELKEFFDDGLRDGEYTLEMLYDAVKPNCAKGAFYKRLETMVDEGKYTKAKRRVNGKRVNAYKKVE